MANSGPFYDVGLYVGEFVSQAIGKAKTGNPQIVFRVKILGTPEVDDTFTPCTQQYERTIYMTLTAGTAAFVSEALERIGFTGTSFSTLDPSSPEHQSFRGQQVNLWCKHETGQDGQVREKWSISKPPSSTQLDVVALSPKELRQLDALFGAALKGKTAAKPVSKPAPKPNVHGVTATDDDLPPMDAYDGVAEERDENGDPLPF
jgi:hypothetical protein